MKIESYINGLLTGLIIGVLFASSAGSETRRKLASRIDKLKRSVNNAYGVTKEEVGDKLTELTSEKRMERAFEIKDNI
jgi:gas vesicle protein